MPRRKIEVFVPQLSNTLTHSYVLMEQIVHKIRLMPTKNPNRHSLMLMFCALFSCCCFGVFSLLATISYPAYSLHLLQRIKILSQGQ